MAAVVNKFIQQRASAKSAGIAIIRNIFKTKQFPEGVTTKELYQLAVKEPAPADFEPYPLPPTVRRAKMVPKKIRHIPQESLDTYPPNPAHPIRSITFLKKDILDTLESFREIRTVRQPRADAKAVEELPLSNPSAPTKRDRKAIASSQMEFVWKVATPRSPVVPPPVKEVYGREVGVGLDVSHLNKRRQRARVEKVSAAVMKMKELNGLNPGERARAARPLAGRPNYRAQVLAPKPESSL